MLHSSVSAYLNGVSTDRKSPGVVFHHSVFTAIIQSCRLTLFGHIVRMDDNADAKRILLALPPADWRRQLGRPRITWLSTVQQDLKQHHLTLPEGADLAQNRPLWSVEDDVDVWRYAILELHARNDDDDVYEVLSLSRVVLH